MEQSASHENLDGEEDASSVRNNFVLSAACHDSPRRHLDMKHLIRDLRRDERTDLRNRFLSIDLDAKFVSELIAAYRRSGCDYPIFANKRNGLWYGNKWDGHCYFKSTDGHSRRWAFSYTRLNVHLASAAASKGGCFIVDSTRSGKAFPDSLTATVPIWCCVLNHFARRDETGGTDTGFPRGRHVGNRGSGASPSSEASKPWDTALHVPRWVSASEASQIEERIQGWIDGLGEARESLTAGLKALKKPLRPVWLSPDTRLVEGMLPAWSPDADLSFTPILCISASRVITPERHRAHHSWVFIQGAGDDEEHWSKGITPRVFWEHSERVLRLAKEGDRREFDDLVRSMQPATAKMEKVACSSGQRRGGDGERRSTARPPGKLSSSPPNGSCAASQRSEGVGEGGGTSAAEDDDVWQPGGSQEHAAIGTTGLTACSLAYAARNWASSGDDCSLITLGYQPCPPAIMERLTGPRRRYLHIPLHPGKGSNPPLYWQKHVFPLTLAHIAAALGGTEPVGDSEAPSTGEASTMSPLRPDRAPVTDAAQHDGGEEHHARTFDAAPSWTNKRSSAGDPCSRTTSAGGERNRRFVDPQDREPRGGSMPVLPSPPSRSPPARGGGDDAGTRLGGSRIPALPPVPEALGARARHGESRSRGKCLVACPTGVEASVIVCLAALLAFFRNGLGVDESRDEGDKNKTGGDSPRDGCGDNSVDDGGNIGGGVNKHERKDEDSDGDQHRHHERKTPSEGPFARCVFVALGARTGVTKVEVRSMLAAIQAYCPSAWPPRRLMKDVDKYFMTPGEHSWATLRNRLLAM